MTDLEIYGLALVVPPEKTVAETYGMLQQLYDDEGFMVSPQSPYDFDTDGMYLTVEFCHVEGRDIYEFVENLGFIVNYDEMSGWDIEVGDDDE